MEIDFRHIAEKELIDSKNSIGGGWNDDSVITTMIAYGETVLRMQRREIAELIATNRTENMDQIIVKILADEF